MRERYTGLTADFTLCVRLLGIVAHSDAVESMAARKQLNKELSFRKIANLRSIANKYWAIVENDWPSVEPHNLADLVHLLDIFAWKLASDSALGAARLAIAEDMVLAAMSLPSGVLRDRARYGAGCLRFPLCGGFSEPDEMSEDYKDYISRVERLIEQNRPLEWQKYVEPIDYPTLDKLKPSVFKTLVLHWYDIIPVGVAEELVYARRAVLLRIPVYSNSAYY